MKVMRKEVGGIRMKVMRKEGSSTVHRVWYEGYTWCNQPGWRTAWDYWENKTSKDGLPIIRCTLRLCKKCFPGGTP